MPRPAAHLRSPPSPSRWPRSAAAGPRWIRG